MLTLDLPTEPYWLDLPRGVRVEIRPVTTAVMAAAQAAAAHRLAASGLDAGGAGADLADALAGEIDTIMRPRAGVVPLAGKALEARDVRDVRGREAADAGDQPARGEAFARLRLDVPEIRRRVVDQAASLMARRTARARKALRLRP
jgi:hypothetical protein